ncbi:MAG: lysozyme inhibitor LprI family protein [Bacillota bacterium]
MMRPSSTTAVLAVTAILALLLVVYVFSGGSAGQAAAPHCTSQQALGQVKGELFRRAAAIRGTKDQAFESVAAYSVLRAGSRLVRRHHGSGKVTCTGVLTLDLPPGAAVAGGRHSLSSNVAFDLAPGSGGGARLLMLSKADDIVVPLATVSNAGNQQGQVAAAVPQADQPQPQQAAPVAPPAPLRTAPPPHVPAPPAPAPVRKTAPPKKAGAPASPRAPASKPAPGAPAAAAAANPSFNCRYARTRGEIAVCSNPGLASLDRAMSAQFYSALKAASPGQRAMLQRSRNRFLAYRDSCGSEACIAEAYRGRMAEISDIMSRF